MEDQLGVSVTSVYNKLQRIEPHTSRAFVRYAYEATVSVLREIGGVPRNFLSGYSMRIVDGNQLAARNIESRKRDRFALHLFPASHWLFLILVMTVYGLLPNRRWICTRAIDSG